MIFAHPHTMTREGKQARLAVRGVGAPVLGPEYT